MGSVPPVIWMSCPSRNLVFLAFAVTAAVAQHAYAPLPKCNYQTGAVQLEATTYVQKGPIDMGCALIGKPGTTIVGGLNGEGISITGPMHFEGGSFNVFQFATLQGPNITFANCPTVFEHGAELVNATV